MRRTRSATMGRSLRLFWLAALTGALLIGPVLTGPAGAQDAASIVQAEAALEAARSSRPVRALAAPELDAAEAALGRALAARDAGSPQGEVGHLAYLAERRAAIARMHARERQVARALETLSTTRDLIAKARALEAAAAERRALGLAQRLARFDVRAAGQGLLLMPRERWFEADLAPTPRARRAIAEAAGLLGELPGREVVVLGYAVRTAPQAAARDGGAGTEAIVPATAGRPAGPDGTSPVGERDDLGCVRADVVRAGLISHGVDPRRIAVRCVAPPDAPEASPAQTEAPSAGEIAITILPEDGPAATPMIGRATDPGPAAPRLSAGAPPDEPPTTRGQRAEW